MRRVIAKACQSSVSVPVQLMDLNVQAFGEDSGVSPTETVQPVLFFFFFFFFSVLSSVCPLPLGARFMLEVVWKQLHATPRMRRVGCSHR